MLNYQRVSPNFLATCPFSYPQKIACDISIFLIARQDRVVPPQIPAAPQDYQVLLRDGDIPQLWPFISYNWL